MEVVTAGAAWVGLLAAYGSQSMETVLICRGPMTLNKIWDTIYKLKTGGEYASQELFSNDENGDKEIFYTGGFLHHKYPLSLIEGTYVFI